VIRSKKHIVFQLVLRAAALLCLFLVFNIIYKKYFWQEDLDAHGPLLKELHDVEQWADVLYFAESSNFNVHESDTDKISISLLLDRYLPNNRVGTVDHAGYHVGQFLPVIENIPADSVPKIIVVTMNLRTFGQDAIFGPNEATLQKAARFNSPNPPLLNRLLISLNHYDNRTPHERDLLKWNGWTYDTLKSPFDSIQFEHNTIRRWCETIKFPDSTGQEDMHRRILADQNIKVFGFHITDKNPMVQTFDKIVQVAKSKNLTLIYNVLAENIEQSDSLVGSNLVWVMKKNRDFLVERYSKMGVIVVDNLELVGNEHFNEREVFPTEHYDETGRKTIARNVANAIKALSN
jgi:hypothetical protein